MRCSSVFTADFEQVLGIRKIVKIFEGYFDVRHESVNQFVSFISIRDHHREILSSKSSDMLGAGLQREKEVLKTAEPRRLIYPTGKYYYNDDTFLDSKMSFESATVLYVCVSGGK